MEDMHSLWTEENPVCEIQRQTAGMLNWNCEISDEIQRIEFHEQFNKKRKHQH